MYYIKPRRGPQADCGIQPAESRSPRSMMAELSTPRASAAAGATEVDSLAEVEADAENASMRLAEKEDSDVAGTTTEDLTDDSENEWHTPMTAAELLQGWSDLASEFPQAADFLCPISGKLMTDPVTADDGFTYEREAIEAWLRDDKNRGSPMLGAKVSTGPTLTPDERRRDAIHAFVSARRGKEPVGVGSRRGFPSER